MRPRLRTISALAIALCSVTGLAQQSASAATQAAPTRPTVAPPRTTLAAPPTTAPAPPATLANGAPDVAAASFILVDADSGTVLAAKDEHTPRLSASTGKTITALTALRLVNPNATMVATMLAASRPASKIGVLPGQQWTFTNLLYCMMLPSANDAAYVVAENTTGNLVDFAKEMNNTAQQLGMRDSTFADPAGLDTDTALNTAANDGRDYVSAYDLAIAGRAVLANPVLAPIVAAPSYAFTGPDGKPHTVLNHNKLARPKSGIYYDGIIGLKTGYTKAANGTFVAAAERNGRRLMAVVMATSDIYSTSRALLDWGFGLATTDAGNAKLPKPVTFPASTHPPAPVGHTVAESIGALTELPARSPITGPTAAPANTPGGVQTPDTVESEAGAEATVPPTVVIQAASPAAKTKAPSGHSDSDTPPIVIGVATIAALAVLTVGARRRLLQR
ncbi:MAG: D-alanyl-D-alanine carboxypeptidase [Acidimicrobiia bacterium]|nr:D-alanyl-D-alanine carboxypeptidase [Acidimicrobiia bacterium]